MEKTKHHISGRQTFLAILGTIILCFFLWSNEEPRHATPTTSKLSRKMSNSRKQTEKVKTELSSQTSQISYSIVNSDILPGIKRSLDVRLNKKISEASLLTIALELKAQDPRNYERTFNKSIVAVG